MRVKTTWAQRTALVGFGLAASLLLLEGLSATLGSLGASLVEETGTVTEGEYYIQGSELGYHPRPDGRFTSKKTVDGILVYDVSYTISREGIRATRGNPGGDTWLFMGGSQMFGVGVDDDETLAAQFSRELDFTSNVVNLGFSGYGPHQMLRSLETGRIEPLIHGTVKRVIYQGIWTHPWRSAGHSPWDLRGPSYSLSEDGVVYSGPFRGVLEVSALRVMMKSDFFRWVLDRTIFRVVLDAADIERFVRILERSAQLAREDFAAEFLVVYWDADNEASRRILKRLRGTTLPILCVSEVIPRQEWPNLTLRGDPHPSAEAYRRLAAGLAEHLSLRSP